MSEQDELLKQLTRIADAIEALALAIIPMPEDAPAPACEHDWVDLGDERECLKCKTRESK